MLYFLNNIDANNQFIKTTKKKYFVDKTELIEKLNVLVGGADQFVCITRPRRFGKSINAMMLASYYTNTLDMKDVFDKLNISECPSYEEHLNKHNVIYISFNTKAYKFETYSQYLEYFESKLLSDLIEFCPDVNPNDLLSDMLKSVYQKTGQGFIFIIDEWDYIFNRKMYSAEDRMNLLDFLQDLLKDQPYVELAYMTGILPIAKYFSGSFCNMFNEFNIINDRLYDHYFGFTQSEVEALCAKQDTLSMDELKEWYNGYLTHDEIALYNPRSVVFALSNGYCDNYWTGTAPMNVILDFIKDNVDNIQEDIVKLVSGESIGITLRGYQQDEDGKEIIDRNSILSMLAIYGNLSYHNKVISIPNKEISMIFENALVSKSLGNLSKITNVWRDMLYATVNQDTDTMSQIISKAHETYIPLMKYNNEDSLATVILLVYLGASETYLIEREMHAGNGYADFVFLPNNKNDTAFILELKVNSTPEKAIEQIKKTKYMTALRNCTGKKLAIGIAYKKKDKEHTVKIEEIE